MMSTNVTRSFRICRRSCMSDVPSTRFSARMNRPSTPSRSARFAASPISVRRVS